MANPGWFVSLRCESGINVSSQRNYGFGGVTNVNAHIGSISEAGDGK